jgi:hypothetical protein
LFFVVVASWQILHLPKTFSPLTASPSASALPARKIDTAKAAIAVAVRRRVLPFVVLLMMLALVFTLRCGEDNQAALIWVKAEAPARLLRGIGARRSSADTMMDISAASSSTVGGAEVLGKFKR